MSGFFGHSWPKYVSFFVCFFLRRWWGNALKNRLCVARFRASMLIPLLACFLSCSVAESTEKCGCYLHTVENVCRSLACMFSIVQVFCKRCSLHLEGRSSDGLSHLCFLHVQLLLKHEVLPLSKYSCSFRTLFKFAWWTVWVFFFCLFVSFTLLLLVVALLY